ncbi:MAG: SDR family oxidoreductase [Gammaproteobacteria bacterium]|nr:SDR family oxidoreductase [Gammaproteobacteria bacterium]
MRPWALITGASAGLGAEFATQYAARGFNLVLVARRRERLEALAQALNHYGVAVLVQPADLADSATPDRLHAAMKAQGIEIDTLVNNAGYGVPGSFMSQVWRTHVDFQQVMVNSVIALCFRFIPEMQQRAQGTIINVASLAGLMPASAGHTLYAPSKAWMIKFSECLGHELKPRGIRVLALCPGFTYTEFHDQNGMRALVSRLPGWLWMTAPEVVTAGLAALDHGAMVCVPGLLNRLLAVVVRVIPARLAHALSARRASDIRRTD